MKSTRKFIGLRAEEVLSKKIDGHIGIGNAGDKDYFANRSAFVRRAIIELLEDLQNERGALRGIGSKSTRE
ncbi:hypothetical protein [Rhizobium laguerreae]|uniref:hypothetical protein n=1 Tax=Rhizobium laguerreae TaxID=1076926 RepID=UPI001C91129A|nr:hypothetical protein [Rhizobium laguerreae]MBY3078439.1 hypothetical protein [Rhizobium laguerreae]MBY3110104.1 hypothetical protein [Rhizobium laguerreae]